MIDRKTAVLLAFREANSRRLTLGQLREAIRMRRGFSSILEELRSIGMIHYSLEGEDAPMTDGMVVSLCSAIHLPADYKLVVLRPDEAEPLDEEPVWQILIHGTPDPRDASEGFYYAADIPADGLCGDLRMTLYQTISSGVVDENWRDMIEPELRRLHTEYAARRK